MRVIVNVTCTTVEEAKKLYEELLTKYDPDDRKLGSEGSFEVEFYNIGYEESLRIQTDIYKSELPMEYKIIIDQ